MPPTLESMQATRVVVNGQQLVNFASNDYLSLASDPRLIIAHQHHVNQYGIGSGASHLVCGHFDVHTELEQALATYLNQADALLFSSGYLANLGVFSALKNHIQWALHDRLNHASLFDASHLIGLRVQRYAHNDITALEQKLQKQRGPGLVASDDIFSMDGDRADAVAIDRLAGQYNSYVLLDMAHSIGMFAAPKVRHGVIMATLGKAFGTMGAVVAGEHDLIDYLRQTARTYIYTTALPPALCATTLTSLEIIKSNKRQRQLFNNIAHFKTLAQRYGLSLLPSDSAIQAMILRDNQRTLAASRALRKYGFLVATIRPPTVAPNTARLRISLNAKHTFKEIEQLLKAMKNYVMASNPIN